jgi:CO/xanthine dehydrogenase FAD-binding subunit
MESQSFYTPETVDEALRILSYTKGAILAGGTDIIPQRRGGRFRSTCLIDASRIGELRFIREDQEFIRIGALATYDDLLNSPLLKHEAAALVQAAGQVGSVQTRQRGTIGGNIANASPAGDTLPPLLVLDAMVHLLMQGGQRTEPLTSFLLGPGKTSIRPGELIHSISFRRLAKGSRTSFRRLGSRAGMAVSIVSVAAAIRFDSDHRIEFVRLALGAVAPTAFRALEAEQILAGGDGSSESIEAAAAVAARACAPIDDIRASAAYRKHAVEQMIVRALRDLTEGS